MADEQDSCHEVPTLSIPSLERWATAVASLEARGPLPRRVVLVPSEAHAHALRVALLTVDPTVLIGARFLTAAAAARAVLDAAGVSYEVGEERLRPLRIRKVLRGPLALTTFRVEDLRTRGWEEAFASSIEQLEAAGLRPADLGRLGDARASDLAALWRAIDGDAGRSWTLSRILFEARALLVEAPGVWPFEAPTLAEIDISIAAVHAQLLHALPRRVAGVHPGRPARPKALDRVRALCGEGAARVIAAPPLSERSATELDLVADFLFEAPDRLASTERARSRGPDGTVSLELYAGADEELEATARWVAEEVFERGTPLHEIAVLVPTADPLASIVADRIGELEWPADIEPVYVAGGRPAVSGASGARLLAVVRALQGYLPAEAMLALIPRLRLSGSDAHVTPGRARAVVSALGTLGGSAARPSDALCWSERLHRADLDDVVRALAPSIEALVAIAAEVLSGAPLTSLWRALRELVMTHVIGSAEMVGLVEQLGDAISEIAADPVAMDVVGVDAIDLVASTLCSLRLQEGRYGGPSIYVGTISGAAGLRFSAIRIIGLTEGAFPGTLREDAVLPSELRQRLPRYAMPTDDDYATGRLHAFARVVRGATRRLVLSAPRTAVDGSEREPAAVFIEVAAALGRPNATTGAPASVVPTRLELERDAFQVARADATARMLASPLSASCWLRSVAFVGEGSASREIPSAWVRTIVTDPVEILARSSNMDGVLGPAPLSVRPHGVSAERPVSASTLRMLLTCPQRFLLERMLGFRPRSQPPGAGRVDRLDPAFYGTLVHAVAEAFSREHGREFGARERDLSHWIELADAVACATFDAFIEPYPLFGRGAVEHERRRLRRDVRTFIEEDWDHGRPRAFVAVEQRFGEAHPVSIPTAAGPLFVSGCIDRIDLENGLTLVRDLKTGRARPRERDHSDPEIELDLQLAVYVAVVRGLAAEWSIPGDVAAAYLYVDPLAVVRERAFREDRVMLRTVSQRWFDVATSLIREQAYVQTPDREDCGRCPFEAVCGDGVEATSRRLAGALGTLGAFRDLKS